MALFKHPAHGTVVYCDFDAGGFRPPEMVKNRPAIVLSSGHKQLVTVVPLSGSEPEELLDHHYEMSAGSLPVYLDRQNRWWAKCDCMAAVGLFRLDLVRSQKRDQYGKRVYDCKRISDADLREIKDRVKRFLSL